MMAGTAGRPFYVCFLVAIMVQNLLIVSTRSSEILCQNSDIIYWAPYDEEYLTLSSVTLCDIHCPIHCNCTIGGNGTFDALCQDVNLQTYLVFPEQVRYLFLANHSLNAIRKFAFSDLADTLEELYLNNNSIYDIQPHVFEGLITVETLYFYDNVIAELLPYAFAGLDSLKILDLMGNVISVVHIHAFQGLGELEELKLGLNVLSELPSGLFVGIPLLESLDLESNHLSAIHPDAFIGLDHLEELALDGNMLQELPSEVFSKMTSLQEIDLDENFISSIPVNLFRGLYEAIELDMDYNMIRTLTPGTFDGLLQLEELELDNNLLTEIPTGLFVGLTNMIKISLSTNLIHTIDPNAFQQMPALEELHLAYNNLTEIRFDLLHNVPNLMILFVDHNHIVKLHSNVFQNLTHLIALSLAQNRLQTLPSDVFRDLHSLTYLNISRNNLHRLTYEIFHSTNMLTTLDLTQNPLGWVLKESFDILDDRTTIYVDRYATCCFIDKAKCSTESPPSPFISCRRLLPYDILRVVVWVVGIGTIVGNICVLYNRCGQSGSRGKIQSWLITNLSMSDLLMGIYMLILGSVDLKYTDYFPSHSESWRHSILCRVAGSLSLLSSEASVFFVTLISFDRFMGVRFPFSIFRLRKTSVKVVVLTLWLIALLISTAAVLIPVFKPTLYDVSEICVGLPISRNRNFGVVSRSFDLNTSSFEADLDIGRAVEIVYLSDQATMFFSIAIFTGLNLVCFTAVAIFYVFIFITAKDISQKAGRTANVDDEIRMAIRMAGIVFSDFCCWMLVVVLSILVQSGAVTIDPEVYAWIATFVLPINSCVNPFLYTLISSISDRRRIGSTTTKNSGIKMSTVSSHNISTQNYDTND